jgi:hydroxymethylglutaryl-CoA reductase
VPAKALGGKQAVRAIVAANRFAREDPYRAATHNKGILNGIDPVLLATGNDWRAVEAGAHAYAARDGAYRALTAYKADAKGDLVASLTLPLAVGTVGGVTRLHPTAKACLKLLGDPDAKRLAAIVASVGLAQNLAALKALAGEGIQKGHMALHASNLALAKKG